MQNNTPNPQQVRVRHATAEARSKLAIDALRMRSVPERRETVYSSGPEGKTIHPKFDREG